MGIIVRKLASHTQLRVLVCVCASLTNARIPIYRKVNAHSHTTSGQQHLPAVRSLRRWIDHLLPWKSTVFARVRSALDAPRSMFDACCCTGALAARCLQLGASPGNWVGTWQLITSANLILSYILHHFFAFFCILLLYYFFFCSCASVKLRLFMSLQFYTWALMHTPLQRCLSVGEISWYYTQL